MNGDGLQEAAGSAGSSQRRDAQGKNRIRRKGWKRGREEKRGGQYGEKARRKGVEEKR